VECGADRGQGLFCATRHRNRIDLLAAISSSLYVGPNTRIVAPLVFGAIGLIALVLALKFDSLVSLPSLFGGIFLILAAVSWIRHRYGRARD